MSAQLREIERLDEAKVARMVAVAGPLVGQIDDAKWELGDAMLVELPMRERRNYGEGPAVQRYLEAVARACDTSWKRLEKYRWVAAAWPADQRHAGLSWTRHYLTVPLLDRDAVIGLPVADIHDRLAAAGRSAPERPRMQGHHSFANISKAAEAAIQVLGDAELPPEKRVEVALGILVRFFAEAAAA